MMGAVVALPYERHARDQASDAELVSAARAGGRLAREALYRRHVSLVLGLLHRILLRDRDVDDLAQDVFVIAFERLDDLTDPQAFAAWVGSIAVRRAREHLRRRRLARLLGFERDTPVEIEHVVAQSASPEVVAELRALYGILEGLSSEARIALVLRRVEGLSIPEIAEAMGLSPATVKRRIQRGEAALASALDQQQPRANERGSEP